MRFVAASFTVAFATGPALAEVPTAYALCMAQAVGQFETRLARYGDRSVREAIEIVSRDDVQHCGALAVASCDGTAAPAACKTDLAVQQSGLRAAVLDDLPAPDQVQGQAPFWSDGLYPQMWDIVHGRSAGPDCAGADADYAAWCATWQANLRLSETVMLWQIGRVLGVARPGPEAGWVADPPPPMPVRRPNEESN